MKTLFFKIILAYSLFFMNHLIVFSQPTDCVANSGETSTIVFGPNVNPTLNGNPLPVGTYIVAVYNSPTGLKCAGYSQWSNAAFGLSPFGATTGFAGYAVGEIYKYRLELPGGIIIPNNQINVTYKSPDGLVCSDGSSYKTNGVSCIESFNAVNSTSSDIQISLIGDAFSQGQWIDDYFLDQSSTNPDLWSKTYKLKKGEVKFRKNKMWDTNWGGNTFPNGVGEVDGPNIKIPIEGEYDVSFNIQTLEYNFKILNNVVLKINELLSSTGSQGTIEVNSYNFKAGKSMQFSIKWPVDLLQLTSVPNGLDIKIPGNTTFNTSKLNEGILGVQWTTNNLNLGTTLVDSSLLYTLKFNIKGNNNNLAKIEQNNLPLESKFTDINLSDTPINIIPGNVNIGKIGILGSATPFGWDDDSFLNQTLSDSDVWSQIYKLKKGELKFRLKKSWDLNWGGESFPTGVALKDGNNIQVNAEGDYKISFNLKNLVYSFNLISSSDNTLIESKLNLYPNPTTGLISIDSESKNVKNMEIRSLDGRLIEEISEIKNKTIDLSHLAPGSYILKGVTNNYPFAKKVVIVR